MVSAPQEFSMNLKTFLFLFILGTLISCASKDKKSEEREFIIPDHYGRSK